MSLIALKFVWAAVVTLLLVGVLWLAAELRYAPPADLRRDARRLVKWGLGVAVVLVLAALVAPSASGLLCWSLCQ